MNRIEKLILRACGYTVLLQFAFYVFSSFVDTSTAYLPRGSFFLILIFGALISISELLFEVLKFRQWIKVGIHYLSLLAVFLIVFVAPEKGALADAGVVVCIACYTLLYAIVFGMTCLFRRIISGANNIRPTSSKDNKGGNSYTPRF